MRQAVANVIEPSGTLRSTDAHAPVGKAARWTGRVLSGLPALFLLFDAVMKLVKPEFVVKATADLGFPESSIIPLGIVLLSCTIVYLIPRTAVLGAILLTGYLGGAIAIQLPTGNPFFGEVLFPLYVGVTLWGGIYLRDARLRTMVPLRS